MPWDALAKIAGSVAAVVVAFLGWRKWGKWKERAQQAERDDEARSEAWNAGEDFDAGGGLPGAVRRARRMRDAKKG